MVEIYYLLENTKINVEGKFGFKFVRKKTERCVDISTALDSTSWPGVIVPAKDSSFHPSWHLKHWYYVSAVTQNTVDSKKGKAKFLSIVTVIYYLRNKSLIKYGFC